MFQLVLIKLLSVSAWMLKSRAYDFPPFCGKMKAIWNNFFALEKIVIPWEYSYYIS